MHFELFKNMLLVGLGSFFGGCARYAVSLLTKNVSQAFPWGTLSVNLLGCLLIGLISGTIGRSSNAHNSLLLFCTYGLCGGFTTFSTFSKEALAMIQQGLYWHFATYTGISVIAGIALTAAGYLFATKI